jgi:hypothetical protein
LFYVDPSNNGGNLAMDISLWDWDSTVVSGVMQDYTIYLESTVLSADHKFNTSEMTPTGGGAFFSTYHVDIPADAVSSTENNEFWVIAECSNKDYTNELGVPNLAGTDPLAAFFRYHLHVGSKPPFTNTPPVINGISDDIVPDGLNTTVYDTDTSVTYSVDYTDPDVGQDHTIAWYIEDASATDPTDPPDAMPYDWSTKPLGDYKIWVKVFDGFDYGIGGPYAITKGLHGWARTWGAGGQDRGYGVATDSAGGIYVTGSYYYNVDFDPGPGQDMHNSNGNRDSFISKFNSNGDFQWARTWDDNASFGGGGNDIATDSQNNVVVAGYFYGTDVDFDPGAGQDLHTSLGTGGDAYITKFDSDGNFLWARTWGGTDWLDDAALGIAVDGSDNVYASGGFLDSVDFDPGAGDDTHASVGYRDIFLTKFDPGGNHLWAQTFGGAYDDYVFGCQVDHNNDVYITGWYYQQVDFDPGPGTDMHDSQVDGHAFLSKFDPSGAWQWARTWGSQDAYGFRVGIDSANDVYVSGGFAGTGQFDPTGGTEMRTANGSRDCFLEKFAPSGTFNWVRIWDSIASGDNTGGYIGYLAKIDPSDNVYVTGHFTQTADLDPGPGISDFTSNGDRDTFVSKLDTSGTFQWARTLGGSSTDDGAGVAIDPNGDVYTTGWFFDTVDFNPGVDVDDHTSNGSLDAFLMKMSKDGTW